MFDDVDDSLYIRIASHFAECPKIKSFMTNLSALTPDVIKEFRIMLDSNEIVENKQQAKSRVLAIKTPFGIGKSLPKEEREIFTALVEKINFTHITPSTIPKMFSHISSRLPKDSEDILVEVEQLFSFLVVCSTLCLMETLHYHPRAWLRLFPNTSLDAIYN